MRGISLSRLGIFAVMVIGLGLSGCGRQEPAGGGDAPARQQSPQASRQQQQQTAGSAGGAAAEPARDAGEGEASPEAQDNPVVAIRTNHGTIRVELWPDKAPQTVENFLAYVDDEFYDGTIFHRVIPGFMIQGGGFTPGLEKKQTGSPIQNEADNRLSNERGTIAMARTPDPHSATAQFFINLADNTPLNFRDRSPQGYGYAVFGEVVEGMSVVDAIAGIETGSMRTMKDVPVEPVLIQEVRRLD